MHVVVHDRDARRPARPGVRSRNRDVVVQAETHRAVALGVMAWRSDQGKRVFKLPGANL
jgi:hypothetical protein